jgi:hypothetical protein
MRGKGEPPVRSDFDDQSQRETHKSHIADWRWGWCGAQPTSVYVGPTDGWYIAPPCEPEYEEAYEKSVVYVIHAPEAGRVKIGTSKHPLRRLADLQVANSHRLVLVRVLPLASEEEMHTRFKSRRVRGEWFDDSILDEIPEE